MRILHTLLIFLTIALIRVLHGWFSDSYPRLTYQVYRALILVLAVLFPLGFILGSFLGAFSFSNTEDRAEIIISYLIAATIVAMLTVFLARLLFKMLRNASWYKYSVQFDAKAESESPRNEERDYSTDISEAYDPFKVLELDPNASPEQIRKAYRNLLKVWHPDRFSHDPELQKIVQERTKQIIEAYRSIELSW